MGHGLMSLLALMPLQALVQPTCTSLQLVQTLEGEPPRALSHLSL